MLLQMMLFYSFHGSSVFSFLRTLHKVLHRGYTIYTPTLNGGGFPFLHPHFSKGMSVSLSSEQKSPESPQASTSQEVGFDITTCIVEGCQAKKLA